MVKKIIKNISSSYIVLIFIILIGFTFVYWFVIRTNHEMQEELLSKARIVASSINIKRLKSLSGEIEDEGKTDYRRIKHQLRYARTSTPGCKFLYLIKKTGDEKVIFLVDSQDKLSKDYAPPGLVYHEVPSGYMPVFNKGMEVAVGPITDRWGKLITALIPIRNPVNQDMIAVLGMDYEANNWNYIIFLRVLPVSIAVLIFIAAISIMVYTSRKLNVIVRKRTSELFNSRERIKTTLLSIGDAVISTDLNGNIVNMNPVAEKLTGYTFKEAQNKPLSQVFNIINAITGLPAVNPVKRVFETGKVVGLANHTALISNDGKEYQIADSGAPIKDKNGNIVGVVLVFRDETENYYKEKQLRDSEEKFRTLAETTSVGIMVYSNDVWVYANSAAENICGYKLDELKNMYFWEFVTTGYQEIAKERGFKRQKGEQTIIRYELMILTRDNEVKWVFIEGGSINFEGKPSGLISVIDITDKKKNEKEIRSSKEKYKALFEQAADGIVVGVEDGTIIGANTNICQMSGYTKSELIGSNISMLFPKDELENNPLQYSSVLTGKTVLRERKMVKKDKSIIYIEMNTKKVGDGRLQSYIRDITRRTNIEKLKREKEIAQRSNQVKQHFIANMSHDMRTPLSGIIGFTNLLMETNLDKRQMEYTGFIKESSDTLLNLVNDVLDISRIEEGKIQLTFEHFNIIKLIEQEIEYFRFKTDENDITLSYTIDSSFPGDVKGDKNRFRQIITNLLSNAVKYTEKGKIEFMLETSKIEDNTVEGKIFVKDTGIGISDEHIETIFETFSRVDDSNTRLTEGTGLGLSITKKLVEMMNGEIGAKSKEGKGSVFWFTFTVEKAKNLQGYPKTSFKDKLSLNKTRILLVEDKYINQKIVQLILEKQGCEVDIANNGEEALELYEDGKYNLIFMDIMMPKMDGITAMNKLKEKHPNLVPVIGLSAHALEGDAQRFIKLGMDDYLAKPVTKEKLVETLFKWVGKK